jgi:hypothetical protein
MPNRIDTALVCINGHIITDSIQVDPKPDMKFCDKCGDQLISECQKCSAKIQGREYIPDIMGPRIVHLHYVKPYCYNCGNPYPWLKSKLDAAKELAELIDEISEEEKEILSRSIDEIIIDSPKTEVAALKFKKIISKVGKSAAESFKSILIDVVSEAAKKQLWP